MRGPLILRLVDIMLLLLLSLMAAASIAPVDAEMPVTHELEDKGWLVNSLNVAITADGALHIEGVQPVKLQELNELLTAREGHLVLYASAEAPARRLIEVGRIARAARWRVAFVVERRERTIP